MLTKLLLFECFSRFIESEEFGRYEDCMINKDCQEEDEKAAAREIICCAEQNQSREPTFVPTDSHIDPGINFIYRQRM